MAARAAGKSHRGQLHDDPVVSILKDPFCLVIAFLCLAIGVLATFSTVNTVG